jgi:hypothetical protein
MRTACAARAVAIAAGVLGGAMTSIAAEPRPAGSNAVEIHWIVQRSDASPDDTSASRQLRMRIPRDYVQNIYRDPRGATEKSRGIRNNGISTVSVEALLPNLSPRLPAFESRQTSPEERRDFLSRQLIIDLKAYRAGGSTRESYLSQARRGAVYRMPDLHGMERFRRMGCGAGSAFDPDKFDVPRAEPPQGCWALAGDEHLIGRDGELVVAVTCAAPSGRCSMQTWFQGFWSVDVTFPHSMLKSWRDVRKQVVNLLSTFVIG